eukprot:CAMPEP_0168723988 /NCGR_PEP_ID=MMETSP0724-20121128/3403_1 /TAXON_ID=265536 /ORGANISM="Amphiprora sp., Strain CCMP467" /LENGTH=474 /DNA_ID=CAMNT_0008770721 /DNA_START=36 /DNA_END=1460 /DNA_ORIENTATION=-
MDMSDERMEQDDDEEVPCDKLLSVMLQDELSDITLKASDGVEVLACRAVLAAKSKVLRKMLYGNFVEASHRTIQIGYEGVILTALVEYIYTDTASLLKRTTHKNSNNNNNDTLPAPQQQPEPTEAYHAATRRVQNLVKLNAAGTYFNLPRLCEKVRKELSAWLKTNPELSFALLEAGKEQGPSVPNEISFDLALYHIRNNTQGVIKDPNMIVQLSSPVLEMILTDQKHTMNEMDLFQLLQWWAQGIDGGDLDRIDTARTLSQHIRLELIDPVNLSTVVTESGLVSESRLCEAYKVLALAAHANMVLPKKQFRLELKWLDSQSDVVTSPAVNTHEVKLLDYPEMTSGTFQWCCELEELCNYTWLGVQHTGMQDANFDDGCFFYSHAGTLYPNRTSSSTIGFGFAPGSKVTLTLDLRADADQGGTLTATVVEGGAPITLFTNMRQEVLNCEGGFVPAAWLKSPGRVRILFVKKLYD